jgi:lipoprotein-releasing system permease protein
VLPPYSKIIEERVLFTFDDKQEVTYLKGIDANFSVNDITKYFIPANGLNRYLPSCSRIRSCAKFSMGLLDFNNQLEVLVPNLEKEI